MVRKKLKGKLFRVGISKESIPAVPANSKMNSKQGKKCFIAYYANLFPYGKFKAEGAWIYKSQDTRCTFAIFVIQVGNS